MAGEDAEKVAHVYRRRALFFRQRRNDASPQTGKVDFMKTVVRTIAALSIVAGAAAAARADTDEVDTKIMGASFCHNHGDADVKQWRGRYTNNSTTADKWVACPVIRDVVGHGGRIVSAWFRAVDQHPTSNVNCGLWSQNSDSFDGWSGSVTSVNTNGDASWVQTRAFPAMAAFAANSFYTMECEIPRALAGKQSMLIAYSVTED